MAMEQAATKQKSSEWLNELSQIVSSTRRRAGTRELDEAELEREVEEWAVACESIPEGRLGATYFRALRDRTVRAAMQPGELYQAWLRLREELGVNQKWVPPQPVSAEACYYCDDTGWQTVAQKAEGSSNENQYVRPCACSMAPSSKRSLVPLREPQWRKRPRSSIWERKELP